MRAGPAPVPEAKLQPGAVAVGLVVAERSIVQVVHEQPSFKGIPELGADVAGRIRQIDLLEAANDAVDVEPLRQPPD